MLGKASLSFKEVLLCCQVNKDVLAVYFPALIAKPILVNLLKHTPE